MNRLAAALADDRSLLWIEATAYAEVLLARGAAPWTDVPALADWMRRSQALLASDVVALPLACLVDAWIGRAPALLTAMSARPRPAFALRTLLADSALRSHVAASLAAVRASLGATPLVLQLPAPGPWLAAEHHRSGGGPIGLDADLAEDAAAYVADFLRPLTGLDGLLVESSAVPTALVNVARQFGWLCGGIDGGPDFAVAASARHDAPTFVRTPLEGESPVARLRHLFVPADADPEAVLAQLARLRRV